jgi:hypothetical protein
MNGTATRRGRHEVPLRGTRIAILKFSLNPVKRCFVASALISRVLQDMVLRQSTKMPIPDVIQIERVEDYWTHDIGRYGAGNQFMAFVVVTLPAAFGADWEDHKRWYAVLHIFNEQGDHLYSQANFMGVTADGENAVVDRASAKRDEMLEALADIVHCNVFIKLFSVTIDDHIFGLIDVTEPEDDHEEVELKPGYLVFYPPWDGSFDT